MNPTQPRHWNAAPRRARWMHRGVAMLMGLGLVALGTGSSGARNAAAEAGWPRFTQGQAQAAKREAQAKLRPKWSAMSWSERFSRVAKLAQKQLFAATEMQADTAAFTGNRTIIRGTTAGLFYLQREADCSLTRHSGTYDFGTSLTLSFTDTAAHLERTLHDAAGLATTAGVFANGCRDSSVGIGSRHTLYLGKTAGGKPIGANFQYDAIADSDLLEFAAIDPAITTTVQKDATQNDVDALAGGDLNGDGLDDVVALSHSTGSVKVWLTRSDGSVGTATTYSMPGTYTEAAALADFNGDGKLDLAVATRDNNTGQEMISILTGKGDGTLNTPNTFNITSRKGLYNSTLYLATMIAADLRGNGHIDLIGSNGLLLLGNGDGTFTPGTPTFPGSLATSSSGPNLAAADFNKDGKLDLAVNDGSSISLYLGVGDGTFTVGHRYATLDTVGYLAATDLDGDGNIDLYVGLGNSGVYFGDEFETNEAYALMGNGDGTFRGAPFLPFRYTGTNLADLDGDGHIDGVGVNPDHSFTTYRSDASGTAFTPVATLTTSPITLGGQSIALNDIDSYALGDVNGDGKPDLVYVGKEFYAPGGVPGVFIALGTGNGSFQAPLFVGVPMLAPASENFDISPILSNIRLADVDHDGKTDLIYAYSTIGSATSTYYRGTSVQRGNGNGTFQAPQTFLFYSSKNSTFLTSKVAAIADVNGDGNPDLILLTESSVRNDVLIAFPYTAQIALGHGDGTFATPADVPMNDYLGGLIDGTQYAPLVLADMNGDGKPDLVTLGANPSGNIQIAIAFGKGDGTFKAAVKTDFTTQYLPSDSLAVGDFDGDGKPDVFSSGLLGGSDTGLSFGNGDGTLRTTGTTPAAAVYLSTGPGAVAADFDGDGKLDVLAGSTLLLSAAATVTPPPPTPDFAISASASSGSIAAGQSATATLTLTPSGGFSGTVSLSCSGAPSGATCSLSPASVALNGAATTTTLTLDTTARSAALTVPPSLRLDIGSNPTALLWALLGPVWLMRRPMRRAALHRARWLSLLILSAGFLCGCGGGGSSGGSSTGPVTPPASGTPAGTYTITVTASSGSLSHAQTYTLTVT